MSFLKQTGCNRNRPVLQNKLHRNAGPEDLVATEAMLERVSRDSSYNADFVGEFRRFTAELRDFFNAGSFADMLQGLNAALDDQDKQVRFSSYLLHHHISGKIVTVFALLANRIYSWP